LFICSGQNDHAIGFDCFGQGIQIVVYRIRIVGLATGSWREPIQGSIVVLVRVWIGFLVVAAAAAAVTHFAILSRCCTVVFVVVCFAFVFGDSHSHGTIVPDDVRCQTVRCVALRFIRVCFVFVIVVVRIRFKV